MHKRAVLLCLTTAVFLTWSGAAPATPPQALTISVSRPADVWSASGAFSDAGTFSDDSVILTQSFTYHAFRTFTGSAGTFTVRGNVRIVPTDVPGLFAVTGHWAVIAGTGAYANLHGTGTITETFTPATGTLAGTWNGSVHFD